MHGHKKKKRKTRLKLRVATTTGYDKAWVLIGRHVNIGTDHVNGPYSTFDILPAQSDMVVLCVSSERANQ